MPTATPTRPSPNRRRCRVPLGPHSERAGATIGARLAAGDEHVIVELYRSHGGRVLGLALSVLRDRQLAEEAVQETFVRVWRHAASFDPRRGLDPWLFRIARNTAYDMARARNRRPRHGWGDPDEVLERRADPHRSSDPGDALETELTRWTVRAAIDALPNVERDVVRLQHLDGLSHQEIADRLGTSIGRVKSRSFRAHRRLAAALRSSEVDDDEPV